MPLTPLCSNNPPVFLALKQSHWPACIFQFPPSLPLSNVTSQRGPPEPLLPHQLLYHILFFLNCWIVFHGNDISQLIYLLTFQKTLGLFLIWGSWTNLLSTFAFSLYLDLFSLGKYLRSGMNGWIITGHGIKKERLHQENEGSHRDHNRLPWTQADHWAWGNHGFINQLHRKMSLKRSIKIYVTVSN